MEATRYHCVRRSPVRAIAVLWIAILSGSALAAPASEVSSTKHNLSVSGSGPVGAAGEKEICAFCHTPHGANNFPGSPLWNREVSGETYTVYSSPSLDAEAIRGSVLAQPAGSSKLCLSCHDGTLAINVVNVLGGQQNVTIPMSGLAGDDTMPGGAGAQTGYTRDLGVDLSNDHPISLTYDATLAGADGELYDPSGQSHIAVPGPGSHPAVPLEPTGGGGEAQVQCATCHDPHIADPAASAPIKFLRLERFQAAAPAQGSFSQGSDIVCLACHDKAAWAGSAHAESASADEVYTSAAAAQREFPASIQVWEAACLNCHDTHTVHGARRLLREGTDSVASPKSGGGSAIEETCYQCHSATPIVDNSGGEVPDIASDFALARHMPITGTDQPAGGEVHDITDKDFAESQALLGKVSAGGSLNNRHVECTDCHNPHRVMKNRLFNAAGATTAGTHLHDSGTMHTNIASGVLRGMWGVEPNYASSAWGSLPSSYTVKEGDGGDGASTALGSAHVTREYQICLKCHSDYGYDDASRPVPGDAGGTTSTTPFSGLASYQISQYTNQAMELQAPAADKGEPGGNHRSWHPVLDNTGRDAAARGGADTDLIWLAPWNGNSGGYIGSLTMYCSDCHGTDTAAGTVEPNGGENGNPWGPHGSSNNFILKGNWDHETGTGQQSDLCFKCHDYDNYANPNNGSPAQSGYRGGGGGGGGCSLSFGSTNLHIGHADRIGRLECTWCHVAVPHGWRNKALLVDISQEGANEPYTSGPYYAEAMLGGGGAVNWQASGNWTAGDCGGRMRMQMSCGNPP